MIGTCRFCGQMKEVRAADQSAADEMTSRSCDCAVPVIMPGEAKMDVTDINVGNKGGDRHD